ncbi:LPS sulfotransferase NodH [Tranquillimonas rosea]|uniref:LPS sulfotransferase NodH n=1 Tax=Tranquillimonas rosea TaxID=641238 RepID=A0A1H9WZE8_9RHOB|nr:sulfotransferase [Tranquillimonas rosea]SES39225.1 LPS sulfotransferase NodH [Tranquillimonas rosea]
MTDQTAAQRFKGRRFVIIGLPRSGTTYLMTLLNAHRDILCSGEQFNPHAIVGVHGKDTNPNAVWGRDKGPVWFMRRFFETHEDEGHARVGFKFMIGHNIRVLKALAEDEDLALIYVHRENKLAQVSSLIKAAGSRNWAQVKPDSRVDEKIKAGPRQISHRWHEYETFDHLFSSWFEGLPHHKLALEYRDMFADGFEERICDFLGVRHDRKMKSPLVKQGSNTILDRFEDPAAIERYFRSLGLGRWLDDEI